MNTQPTALPAEKYDWRTQAFDPDCRREWARLTDNRTYKGPHNICAEEEPEFRFLGLRDVVLWIAAGMAAVAWAALTFQGF